MFGALISATDPVTVLSIFQVPGFVFIVILELVVQYHLQYHFIEMFGLILMFLIYEINANFGLEFQLIINVISVLRRSSIVLVSHL